MDPNYLVVASLTEMFEESNHLFTEEMKFYLHNKLEAYRQQPCSYEGLANIISEWVENYPHIKTILGLKVAVKKVQSLT